MKILGRDPATWLALIGSGLMFFADEVPYLSTGQAAAVMALLTAGAVMLTTRPITVGMFLGILAAAVALTAEYGVALSGTWVERLTQLTLAVLAFAGVRPQVSPISTPVSRS